MYIYICYICTYIHILMQIYTRGVNIEENLNLDSWLPGAKINDEVVGSQAARDQQRLTPIGYKSDGHESWLE